MAEAKKKEQNVVQMGGNISGLMEKLVAYRDRETARKKERSRINAEGKADREAIEALGVTKKALAAAYAYFTADAEVKKGFDEGYIVSREAFGVPVKGAQLELLEGIEKPKAAAGA